MFFFGLCHRSLSCIINGCDNVLFAFDIARHGAHNIQCSQLEWLVFDTGITDLGVLLTVRIFHILCIIWALLWCCLACWSIKSVSEDTNVSSCYRCVPDLCGIKELYQSFVLTELMVQYCNLLVCNVEYHTLFWTDVCSWGLSIGCPLVYQVGTPLGDFPLLTWANWGLYQCIGGVYSIALTGHLR